MNDNKLVVKHNKLIEANYKLSLQEQKLILILAKEIKKGDREFRECIFTVEDLALVLNLNKKSYYSELKELTEKLLGRVLQIKEPDGLLQINWINSAKYYDAEGKVELGFSKKMKPYLLQLGSHFTKLEFKQLVSLNSIYAIRIYELLKQYENLKERIFKLDELKSILKITEKSYDRYDNFKRSILLMAEREINEKTDIEINFEEIKTVRKVTSIKFLISQKEEIEVFPAEVKKTIFNDDVEKLFQLIKSTEKVESMKKLIDESLKKYSYEIIASNIKYSNSRGVKNYQSYLIIALKKDYAEAEREKKTKQQTQMANFEKEKAEFENYFNEYCEIEYSELEGFELKKYINEFKQNEEIYTRANLDLKKYIIRNLKNSLLEMIQENCDFENFEEYKKFLEFKKEQ